MIKKNIDHLIAEAMKSGDKERLDVLRLIKTELVKREKDGVEITESVEASVLMKMVAQREDSIKQFKDANREDLVENESKQLTILKEFAPKQVTDEEIRRITEQMIVNFMDSQEKGHTLSMKDMRPILLLVQEVHLSANGKLVSQIIQEQIKK